MYGFSLDDQCNLHPCRNPTLSVPNQIRCSWARIAVISLTARFGSPVLRCRRVVRKRFSISGLQPTASAARKRTRDSGSRTPSSRTAVNLVRSDSGMPPPIRTPRQMKPATRSPRSLDAQRDAISGKDNIRASSATLAAVRILSSRPSVYNLLLNWRTVSIAWSQDDLFVGRTAFGSVGSLRKR